MLIKIYLMSQFYEFHKDSTWVSHVNREISSDAMMPSWLRYPDSSFYTILQNKVQREAYTFLAFQEK